MENGTCLGLHLLPVLLKFGPELLPVLPEVRALPLSHQQQERQNDRQPSQHKGTDQPCEDSPYHPAHATHFVSDGTVFTLDALLCISGA